MLRLARLSKLKVFTVIGAATLGASAMAQVATPPASVVTQAYTCPTETAVPAAVAAPAGDALPVPPPQEVVKPEAYETGKTNKGFPRWSDFPPPPKDVPDEAEFGRRVAVLGKMHQQFSVSLNNLQWDVSTPEAIKAEGEARINPAYLARIETMTCEQYAEFVRYKQKLATPPPIADN